MAIPFDLNNLLTDIELNNAGDIDNWKEVLQDTGAWQDAINDMDAETYAVWSVDRSITKAMLETMVECYMSQLAGLVDIRNYHHDQLVLDSFINGQFTQARDMCRRYNLEYDYMYSQFEIIKAEQEAMNAAY